MTINLPIRRRMSVLALGAESAGVFAVYSNGNVFISGNFGDLLDENNFLKYKKAVLAHLRKGKIKPDATLTDLHPLFKTTALGEELAKKYVIPQIRVQHHIAHIFSAVGDRFCHPELVSGSESYRFRNKFGMTDKYQIPNTFLGIAMDGTGYGLDGNIWGGEVFRIQIPKPNFQIPNKSQNPIFKIQTIRIGSLEEQIMIGGDLAVREPARMLIAILAKLKNENEKTKTTNKKFKIIRTKDDIYNFVKKFYKKNEFELLYNQFEQNFNCQTTTSTGRALDAVSVLLGFAGNERRYKHEAIKLLEKNSTIPYDDIESRLMNYSSSTNVSKDKESKKILNTTYLFEYLLKNIHKDKKRLAATAQLYIAKGLYEIIKKIPNTKYYIPNTIFAGGGMVNNKIISDYLENYGVYLAKKIPRGDEGIAVGQIVYYLANSRHQFSSRHFNWSQTT